MRASTSPALSSAPAVPWSSSRPISVPSRSSRTNSEARSPWARAAKRPARDSPSLRHGSLRMGHMITFPYARRAIEFPGGSVRETEEGLMELKGKEELRNEILQYWLRSAWVYPFEGPDERTYLRLTPGGRLKMRRRIGELEKSLGVDGVELARQEEAGTLPVERDRLELAMMVHAYDTERRLIQSQGATLGTPAVTLEDQEEEEGPDTI